MRMLLAGAVVALAACEPEVFVNTYFCGPNRSCPPGQDCDDATITCGDPQLVERFECPVGTQAAEPDDELDEAIGLGPTRCSEIVVAERPACIGHGNDVDVYRFEHPAACERRNDVAVAISFPFAFVPLEVEILDGSGAVISAGSICTVPNSTSGREQVCAEATMTPGVYYARVRPRVGAGLDCNGDCAANEYILDIELPP